MKLVIVKNRLKWALIRKGKKQRRLDDALLLLSADPRTKELLEIARADNIEIRFAPEWIGTAAGGALVTNYEKKKEYIVIRPMTFFGEMESAYAIAAVLAHELRHYWQRKTLGLTLENGQHVERSPRLAFIFNRVIEADAFAFEHSFELHAGIRFAWPPSEAAPTDQEDMRKEFLKKLHDDFFSRGYDPRQALVSNAWYTGPLAKENDFDKVKSLPEMTVSDLRKILKSGTGTASPGYMDDLSDRNFEALVLKHSHKKARQAVRLIEKFRQAAAGNDNATAEELRKKVQVKIYGPRV